jgi:hypothetical protein
MTLPDKSDKARKEIQQILLLKYAKKINSQRNKLNKEIKYASSILAS